jgi:hypothetical protein
MVAQACGSWFPWTMTTTGREGAHTCSGWIQFALSHRRRREIYLMMELPVADRELGPEKKCKFLVHH